MVYPIHCSYLPFSVHQGPRVIAHIHIIPAMNLQDEEWPLTRFTVANGFSSDPLLENHEMHRVNVQFFGR
jgi:hypothetical protein